MKFIKYIPFILTFLIVLIITSCNEDDVCNDVDCSGHGTCKNVNNEAQCSCNEGYFNDGPLYCVSPCDGVDCSDHGICSYDEDLYPSCTCEDGYENNGPLECIQIPYY